MNKKQLSYAGIAIIVLALIYFFSSSGRTVQKSVDSNIFQVDSSSVNELMFFSKTDTLTFKRDAKGWMLDGYKVDASKFRSMFETLTDLVADRFVSKNKNKFGQYGVDSTAEKVVFKSKTNATIKEILVGERGSSGNETFVRTNDGKKVYTVAKDLNAYKNLKRSQYWYKTIVKFKPEDVFSVKMEGNINYSLEQKNLGWTYDNQLMDAEKSRRFIEKLVDQNASAVSREEIPSVAILKATETITPRNGKVVTIKYYENDDKSTTIYAQVVGNPMRFEIYKSIFDGFNKRFDELKPAPEKKETAGTETK